MTRNPYLSTLIKRLKEQQENDEVKKRLEILSESPSKEEVLQIYSDCGVNLPQAHKLSPEQKAQRKAEKAEKVKKIIDDKFAVLKDVLENGEDEAQKALENIIKQHQKTLSIREKEKELEEQKKKVERLEKEIEKLKQ
jgi:hypothetical protein